MQIGEGGAFQLLVEKRLWGSIFWSAGSPGITQLCLHAFFHFITWIIPGSQCISGQNMIHFLLFITKKYNILNANLELNNAKILLFYWIDTQLRFCHFRLKVLHGMWRWLAQIRIHFHQSAFNNANRRPLTLFYCTLGRITLKLRKTVDQSITGSI